MILHAHARGLCIFIVLLLTVGCVVAEEEQLNPSSGSIDRSLLEHDQLASLQRLHYAGAPTALLPDDKESARFGELRASTESDALDELDRLYADHHRLKALALRDSDRDGVPDFRVSDYYGKFMEGDVDLDDDGVRNALDSDPFDRGVGLLDANTNGLPDSIDWSLLGREPELAEIQLGLHRDHGIALVDRDARFDLELAEAVDDTVRRVFRQVFESENGLPNLRTIATEKTVLLNAALAGVEEDETAAQVFPRTQSLIIYDVGRRSDDRLLLLGLLVHEMGHSFHMSLDDALDLVAENGCNSHTDTDHCQLRIGTTLSRVVLLLGLLVQMGHSFHMSLDFDALDLVAERRTRFPTPHFVELLRAFEWEQTSFYEGELGAGLAVVPRFVYMGMSEPVFSFRGKDPKEWKIWAEEVYKDLGEPPTYLLDEAFASRGIVSDDALSLPSEWFADNLIAYVITVIEAEALETHGTAAQLAIDAALRAVWPTFYHRNLASDIRAYFERTFPITESDRRLLAERYIAPIVASASRSDLVPIR